VTEGLFRKAAFAAVLISAAYLSGCASRAPAEAVSSGSPPEVLYSEADALLGKSDFAEAAKKFEEVDRDHPYSPYARRAIAMSAFSHYKAGQYQEAIQAAKRYSTLHPGTKEAALAQHIIAMSYYDRITDPSRDQGRTRKAREELQKLVRRYPESSYALKARNRIKITTDMLAAAEMKVGRYYHKQRTYLAAINRYRIVITTYQTTAQVEEALMRVAEAYMALGIVSEAQTATAVLGHNFPDSQWYRYAYKLIKKGGLEPREDNTSWISRSWRKVKPGSS